MLTPGHLNGDITDSNSSTPPPTNATNKRTSNNAFFYQFQDEISRNIYGRREEFDGKIIYIYKYIFLLIYFFINVFFPFMLYSVFTLKIIQNIHLNFWSSRNFKKSYNHSSKDIFSLFYEFVASSKRYKII